MTALESKRSVALLKAVPWDTTERGGSMPYPEAAWERAMIVKPPIGIRVKAGIRPSAFGTTGLALTRHRSARLRPSSHNHAQRRSRPK